MTKHSKNGKLKYMWIFVFLFSVVQVLHRNETEGKRVSSQLSNKV